MKTAISLNFTDFWDGFDKTNNFFYNLLTKVYDIEISEHPDYLIYSTMGRAFLQYDCVRIFFTGENVRPDFNLCDYAIGFDYMEYEDRYMRYPLYLLYRDSWNKALHKHELTKEQIAEKKKFCNFIYSNANITTARDDFFRKLSLYKKVDSGGRHLNNIGGPVDKKVPWQSDYKFTIAFENSIQSGYQTEKLIEAYAAGTVPIYYGNPRVLEDINENSLIVCRGIEDFDRAIQQVKVVDGDDVLYRQMIKTPMLKDEKKYCATYSEDRLMEFFAAIFSQGKTAARRRNHFIWETMLEDDLRIAERAKAHKYLGRIIGIV